MSSISGVTTSALDSILGSLGTTASAASTASESGTTSAGTTTEESGTTGASSVALAKAETQLSLMGTLLGSSTLGASTMEQLAMSANNFQILAQSGVLKTHPELIGTLFNTGSSSQASTSSGTQAATSSGTSDSSGTSTPSVDVVA